MRELDAAVVESKDFGGNRKAETGAFRMAGELVASAGKCLHFLPIDAFAIVFDRDGASGGIGMAANQDPAIDKNRRRVEVVYDPTGKLLWIDDD